MSRKVLQWKMLYQIDLMDDMKPLLMINVLIIIREDENIGRYLNENNNIMKCKRLELHMI